MTLSQQQVCVVDNLDLAQDHHIHTSPPEGHNQHHRTALMTLAEQLLAGHRDALRKLNARHADVNCGAPADARNEGSQTCGPPQRAEAGPADETEDPRDSSQNRDDHQTA
ncbi:hypothetical protein [Segeticoccus rhizosphaerae]|jgi:hypothetical protein|uniref:hypothetical protein n=1 Tax=Segeticoccus rhizosphaerae TaxID=1104777 RepID=UPI00126537F3|nr:hypothetical protein [Segeticoccus rhizosphaerae]